MANSTSEDADLDPSYLVMTAADCASYNRSNPHSIVSLNQLLEERALNQGDDICVGFINRLEGDNFICRNLTFTQLYEKVCKTAYLLLQSQQQHSFLRIRGEDEQKTPAVALLAPSCEEFLVETFALFRLGWSVLLVAPQNTPEDIAKLCETTGISHLIYHESMQKAAQKAESVSNGALIAGPLLVFDERQPQHQAISLEESVRARSPLTPEQESETECIIFHSSGSSGTPKPIPQKHKIWTTAASTKPHSPSFTTTPLFHGGISDLLRAMMNKSTLYMYPSTLPITAFNLLASFKSFSETSKPTSFLSVPYILEMLADVPEGFDILKNMEMVSTGGSPLSRDIGDAFVKAGVNLVSRYGSSESGFLMTSNRDFDKDKEWSHLRPSAGKSWLIFEDQGDASYELVVPVDWPTRNKSNRPDGTFATSDLFRKHPTIKDAWMLSGRSDDVILMSNGEKASPAPLEAIIRRSSLVKEALVFGVNRSMLGVAIIPSQNGSTAQSHTSAIQEANKAAPSHAQIAPELVIVLSPDQSFPKASKGTLQRGKAYDFYESIIDGAYQLYESSGETEKSGTSGKLKLSEAQLLEYIVETIAQVMQLDKTDVEADDDLFNLGLNSVQALRVRNLLKTSVDIGDGTTLVPNVVYECSTARRLAKYMTNLRSGLAHQDDDLALMAELAQGPLNTFGAGQPSDAYGTNGHAHTHTCILTGATGSLGAQLIPQLLARHSEWHIACLVRASDDEAARQRVLDTLKKHHINLATDQLSRVSCYAAILFENHLGLSSDVYDRLAGSADLVIHAAWPVHFGAGLQSFVPHLQGLHNLILLSRRHDRARLLFCSSTASVLAGTSPLIRETVSNNPRDAKSLGYARSKHCAETICASAWKQNGQGRIGILRLGQLSGDTKYGIWKTEEGWPQLFASAGCVGCLPELQESINWLPMDKAAEAIVDIASLSTALADDKTTPVFHISSTNNDTTYANVVSILKKGGLQLDLVPASHWLAKLQAADENGNQHSCLRMLDMWQKNYGSNTQTGASAEPIFETVRAETYTKALREPITDKLMLKMLKYWQEEGLVHLK